MGSSGVVVFECVLVFVSRDFEADCGFAEEVLLGFFGYELLVVGVVDGFEVDDLGWGYCSE